MVPTRRELLLSIAATACAARGAAPIASEQTVGGGVLAIRVASGTGPPLAVIERWIANSADAVSRWYGRFPVPNVRIEVGLGRGHRVGSGLTFGLGDPNIQIDVGDAATQQDLDDDWVLVHEMVHLAFPNVERRHHWIEEGISTYVEPWARAEVGRLDLDVAWRDFAVGLPQGLPEAGDAGLDQTPTWGRTYWGGALFCFLADIEALEKTEGERKLQDALRAILASTGGMVHADLPLAEVFATGDAALGVPVLVPLYERMRADPHPVDLDPIWARLGVEVADGRATFRDDAPLAWVRRAIARMPGGAPH